MERGVHCNFGPLSPHAADALQARGIDVPADIRFPQQLTGADLEAADLVIALKEAEHRPMLIARFPDWVNRVEYWHVHDLDQSPPQHATAEIEILVRTLLKRLARKERA